MGSPELNWLSSLTKVRIYESNTHRYMCRTSNDNLVWFVILLFLSTAMQSLRSASYECMAAVSMMHVHNLLFPVP